MHAQARPFRPIIVGRLFMLAAVLLLPMLLSGCALFGGLELSFSPNPIVLHPGDNVVQGQLTIKASGIGTIHVTKASAVLRDSAGNTIESASVQGDAAFDIPALAGKPFSTTIKFDDKTYAELKAADADNILISIEGDFNKSFVVKITLADS